MARNISLELRQRELEAQVQIGWADVACSVLRAMADGGFDRNPVEAMRKFVELHDAAEKATNDPRGVAIRMPLLDRGQGDRDRITNMIVRGSLRMLAARLEHGTANPGECPGRPKGPDYESARREVVHGIALMEELMSER